jgi:serine protease Do
MFAPAQLVLLALAMLGSTLDTPQLDTPQVPSSLYQNRSLSTSLSTSSSTSSNINSNINSSHTQTKTKTQTQGASAVAKQNTQLNTLFYASRGATFKLDETGVQGDGYGTGFFISADGYALSAYHVVEGAKTLMGTTPNNKTFTLELIGFDAAHDLALLKYNTKDKVAFLPLSSGIPAVGETVLAIGNSGEQFLQPRAGNLLQLDVAAGRADFPPNTLELSAPLAPGDSGGPVLNSSGEVIGVVSYIRPDITSYHSFAVPVRQQLPILIDLQAGAKRDVPALGITSDLDGVLSLEGFQVLGLGKKQGAIIEEVIPNSPAAKAGLRSLRDLTPRGAKIPVVEADVIIALDNNDTPSFGELLNQIRQKRIGDQVLLTVQRGRQTLEVKITLGAKADIFY